MDPSSYTFMVFIKVIYILHISYSIFHRDSNVEKRQSNVPHSSFVREALTSLTRLTPYVSLYDLSLLPQLTSVRTQRITAELSFSSGPVRRQ